ncbi:MULTISPECIES: TolB family protein [Arcicella]|uniref:WD40 repeat protein n=1 Tax=Arcicella lustrica TaxID=2984196 RepID=A0ABU5SJZ0_9BACT|nr:hypothetical protein [Arcicella sp. DC25W]MEA5427621.1 hypothetical protein [Arcicella sp. DC25W]
MKQIKIQISILILITLSHFGLGQVSKKRLPSPINSEFLEDSPSISADRTSFIYQSNKYNPNREVSYIGDSIINPHIIGIFETKLHQRGEYQPPQAIENINNFFQPSRIVNHPNISYDGNSIFFSGINKIGKGSEDIYFSTRINDNWSIPQNAGEAINTAAFEGSPSISPDGKRLFFIREIPNQKIGNQQCYKILLSERESINDPWERPIQLPYPINQGCECAPRIHADGKTLFFSSIRKESKGDFDVYKSVLQDDGTWLEPVNLKFINSRKDDKFVTINPCGDILYFVSDGDIYSSVIPEEYKPQKNAVIQGFVLDSLSQAPLHAKIDVIAKTSPSEIFATFETNISDGRYTVVLPTYDEFTLNIKTEGYINKGLSIGGNSFNNCELIAKDFLMQAIPKLIPASTMSVSTPTPKNNTKTKRIEILKNRQ